MAVRDNSKCKWLTAFIKEALEHRSPCQDTLLVVQWKMIQISLLDCQVDTVEIPCKWEPEGSVFICVIWYLPNAPHPYPPLTDNLANQTGSANTCRATPSPWKIWASCFVIIASVLKRGLTYLSGCCPAADETAPCVLVWWNRASKLKSRVTVLQRLYKKGRRYKKLSSALS